MIFNAKILTKELTRQKFIDQVSDNVMVNISNVKVTQIEESLFIIELDARYFSLTELNKTIFHESYRLTVPTENKSLSVEVMQNGYRKVYHAELSARVGFEIEKEILDCLHREYFYSKFE